MKTAILGIATLLSTVLVAACGSAPSSNSGSTSEASRAAKCEAASDCEGALPRNEVGCADGTFSGASWDCNDGKCAIGYCENNGGTSSSGGTASNSGACSSASDCTGLLPRDTEPCADGSNGTAQWDCNSGTCAISYCDNSGGVASSGGSSGGSTASGSCSSASDCSGLLPRNTEQCADGTSAGAQWDCNSGTCAISYCDNNGGTAN